MARRSKGQALKDFGGDISDFVRLGLSLEDAERKREEDERIKAVREQRQAELDKIAEKKRLAAQTAEERDLISRTASSFLDKPASEDIGEIRTGSEVMDSLNEQVGASRDMNNFRLSSKFEPTPVSELSSGVPTDTRFDIARQQAPIFDDDGFLDYSKAGKFVDQIDKIRARPVPAVLGADIPEAPQIGKTLGEDVSGAIRREGREVPRTATEAELTRYDDAKGRADYEQAQAGGVESIAQWESLRDSALQEGQMNLANFFQGQADKAAGMERSKVDEAFFKGQEDLGQTEADAKRRIRVARSNARANGDIEAARGLSFIERKIDNANTIKREANTKIKDIDNLLDKKDKELKALLPNSQQTDQDVAQYRASLRAERERYVDARIQQDALVSGYESLEPNISSLSDAQRGVGRIRNRFASDLEATLEEATSDIQAISESVIGEIGEDYTAEDLMAAEQAIKQSLSQSLGNKQITSKEKDALRDVAIEEIKKLRPLVEALKNRRSQDEAAKEKDILDRATSRFSRPALSGSTPKRKERAKVKEVVPYRGVTGRVPDINL